MEDATLLSVALALALIGVVFSWKVPGECGCDKCAVHVAERAARAPKHTQDETQHEVQHKGFGFKWDAPDTMDCRNSICPRNSHTRRIGP